MAGSQLPSNDSDRIFHCFVSFFLFNLPSLSHLLVVVYWLSHVTLCKPMDCGPPGSSVHGISQAKKRKKEKPPVWGKSAWTETSEYTGMDRPARSVWGSESFGFT